MRKISTILLIMMLIALPVGATNIHRKSVETAQTAARATAITVASTGTVYTKSFPIFRANSELNMGVMYQQTPATGDTLLSFQQSTSQPATEGSSDDEWLTTVVLDTSVTGTQWEMATVDALEFMYGRFKIEGQNSNPVHTSIHIKFVK